MQKKIKEYQTKSALAMEQEEKKRRENKLALKRKKCGKEAHLELLRTEREAVVTTTPAKAINEELGLEQDKHLSIYQMKNLAIVSGSSLTASFRTSTQRAT